MALWAWLQAGSLELNTQKKQNKDRFFMHKNKQQYASEPKTKAHNCFLPFIFIRSLYNGRQYLNYKSPEGCVCDTGWIHSCWGDKLKSEVVSTCKVFVLVEDLTCGSQTVKSGCWCSVIFLCKSSVNPASVQRTSFICSNKTLKEGFPLREEKQVYCIDWGWF